MIQRMTLGRAGYCTANGSTALQSPESPRANDVVILVIPAIVAGTDGTPKPSFDYPNSPARACNELIIDGRPGAGFLVHPSQIIDLGIATSVDLIETGADLIGGASCHVVHSKLQADGIVALTDEERDVLTSANNNARDTAAVLQETVSQLLTASTYGRSGSAKVCSAVL